MRPRSSPRCLGTRLHTAPILSACVAVDLETRECRALRGIARFQRLGVGLNRMQRVGNVLKGCEACAHLPPGGGWPIARPNSCRCRISTSSSVRAELDRARVRRELDEG